MKKLIMIFTCLLTVISVNAQTSVTFSANSGDAELDVSLSNLNTQAKLDLSVFKKDMSVSFGVTDGKLDKLLVTMQPADIFMSLQIGKLVSKPVDDVVKSFEINKKKGWGAIAKEMGIKPGSKEFHELKGKAKAKSGKKEKVGGPKVKGKVDGAGNSNGKGKNK